MKPYKLPRKFILVFLLILFLITGGGVWFYFEQRELLKGNINDDLMTIAQAKIEMINTWRRDQILEGNEMAENQYLIQDLSDWQETRNPETEEKIISYLKTIQTHYGYSDITFVSAKLQPLLSLSNELEPIDVEAIGTLNEAMEKNETRLTDLHIGAHDQNPHISVIVPLVRQENGKQTQIGALMLINDARDFLYPLIQSWPTKSKTAESLLVEQDGDYVVFLNDLRHQNDTALKLRFDLTDTEIPAVRAVLGSEGIFIGQDYRGVEVLSAMMPIPDSPWFMVAKIDTSEALAVWRTNATLIVGMLLGIIGIFAGAAVVIWQREEKRHYFRLAAVESARQESEASHLVTLMSVGDGVIVTDKFGFIQLINPVAEALTGCSHAKAKGKPLTKVFHIINEETQEKVENPVEKVISEGLVVGLANHTLLVARDGSRRPIADSGAPIRNDKGEIGGVVLVFRDQTVERESQRELVESEEKFRTYFSSTPTAITLSNPDGKYVMANPAFCDLVGYPQKEVLVKNVSDFTHPDDKEAFHDRVRTMLSGVKVAYKIEKRIVRKDGSVIWVEGNTNLVRDERGKPLFFLSNLNNITERKLAEENLRESEEMLKKAQKVASLGSWIWTIKTNSLVWSDEMYRIFGIEKASFSGDLSQVITSAIHPDDRAKVKKANLSVIKEKRSTPLEYRVLWPDGSIHLIWAEAGELILDKDKNPEKLTGIAQDITEFRLAEEKIKASEVRYRRLFESAKDGILILDFDSGKVVDVNPFLYELLGLKSADIMGKELWQIGLFKDIADSKDAFIKLKKEKFIRYEDMPLRNNKGKEINVEFISNVYEVNSHKVIQCNIRDITIRKKAEDQIRKMNGELEQRVEERTRQLKKAQEQLIRQERLAVLGQLAGGVSHELRNPLGVISNAVYLLGMFMPKADPKTREYISIIDAETHRAEKIITDLLDFSRVKDAEKELFDLKELLDKTQRNIRKPGNIKIQVKFPEKLPMVLADPSQITLVIGNLLENAYQAMPEGGTVTVTGKEMMLKKKPHIALEVKDAGSGIAPENLPRIFEPLFTTKQRGIGLGLATSKTLVESNGGILTVKSEPGKGSQFTVFLPSK